MRRNQEAAVTLAREVAMKLSDLVSRIDRIIPPALAEERDNVGLQLGDEDSEIKKALITLDARKDVPAKAKRLKCQLVITHHPLIFDPVERIVAGDAVGKVILQFIRNNIALFSAHTNFDSIGWGVNDVLGGALRLRDCRPLEVSAPQGRRDKPEAFYKLVVFVPEGDLKRVQRAIFSAGAGRIGRYEMCSWRTGGVGSFTPLAGTRPAVGERGKYEEVDECRLEVLAERSKLSRVIEAVKKAHPYEEPAFDVYPLENCDRQAGMGRIGRLEKGLSLRRIAGIVKRKSGAQKVLITGNPEKSVKKVAVCGGGGRGLIEAAIRERADLFLTGEVTYHDRLKCDEMGLALIEAGHFETEVISLRRLRDRLQEEIPEVRFVLDASCKNVSRYV